MRLKRFTFTKIWRLFDVKSKEDAPSFFDYSAKEKKDIINKAAKEANKMQKELSDKYDRLYPRGKPIAKAYATK